jgi:hypothetical protein
VPEDACGSGIQSGIGVDWDMFIPGMDVCVCGRWSCLAISWLLSCDLAEAARMLIVRKHGINTRTSNPPDRIEQALSE